MAITFGLTKLVHHYRQLSCIIYMLISLSWIIDSYVGLGVATFGWTWTSLYWLPNYSYSDSNRLKLELCASV